MRIQWKGATVPDLAEFSAARRQARERLLEAARRREIDVVLVWRLDPCAHIPRLSGSLVGQYIAQRAVDAQSRPTGASARLSTFA